MDAEFLRLFLLQRKGSELVALIDGCDDVLLSLTRVSLATPSVRLPLTIDPILVILDTREFIIRFDGSYMPTVSSGIGVTLGYRIQLLPLPLSLFLPKLMMRNKQKALALR